MQCVNEQEKKTEKSNQKQEKLIEIMNRLYNFKNAHILCTQLFDLHVVFDELVRRHRINSYFQ